MDARTSKRQKKISAKQEKELAADLGGRTQPASGAMTHAKGDVRNMGVVRAEAKYTSKEWYPLKLADMQKIIGEAGLERAVLQVRFVERSGKPIIDIAIFPCPWDDLLRARVQSVGKSLRLYRDQVAVKLLKEDYYVVFSDHRGAGAQWFRILEWKDYLTLMEERNA